MYHLATKQRKMTCQNISVWLKSKLSTVKKSGALNETPSQSYCMSVAIRDHACYLPYGVTMLPVTQHKWTHPALTPARGRYLIYLPGMDGRLSLPKWPVIYWDGLCISKLTSKWHSVPSASRAQSAWEQCKQTVTHNGVGVLAACKSKSYWRKLDIIVQL